LLSRQTSNACSPFFPDIDIHYHPTLSELEASPQTMREVLLSIPGFTASKIRNIHNKNKNNKKLSAAAAVQLAHEVPILFSFFTDKKLMNKFWTKYKN
jgi:hypothetical protein